jgi:type I restriction enzyme S subunit
LELGKCSFIDATRLSEFESKIIRNGDILMALTGYIGRMCLVQNLDQPVLQNYRVGKFVITDSSLNTSYFYHLLKSPVIQNQIANKIHEAAQGNIGKGDIEKLKIPLPSHKEQEAIAHRLNKIQDQKSLLISKLTSSKSLQNSLINQTF